MPRRVKKRAKTTAAASATSATTRSAGAVQLPGDAAPTQTKAKSDAVGDVPSSGPQTSNGNALGVGALSTPKKSFLSPRKEEERRRMAELEFVEAFRHRHKLETRLDGVEQQIHDLEMKYLFSFNKKQGNAVQGYDFAFLSEQPAKGSDADEEDENNLPKANVPNTNANVPDATATANSDLSDARDAVKGLKDPEEALKPYFIFSQSSETSQVSVRQRSEDKDGKGSAADAAPSRKGEDAEKTRSEQDKGDGQSGEAKKKENA